MILIVVQAMRLLAAQSGNDPGIVAGPSGAAGLAGLLALREDPVARQALELDATSRVLLINTERDTDAAAYVRLMNGGRP